MTVTGAGLTLVQVRAQHGSHGNMQKLLWSKGVSASSLVQSQNAVSVYLTSEKILPFGFAEHGCASVVVVGIQSSFDFV